jgi:hypothetical protein
MTQTVAPSAVRDRGNPQKQRPKGSANKRRLNIAAYLFGRPS